MEPILEIRDLKVQRGGKEVLSINNLQVNKGQVLAVIGPNGAGKSTLLMAVSRLIKPAGGQILFRGEALDRVDELTYRRRIALVLQEPLLLDTTVFNNAATGLKYRGVPRKEIRQRTGEWLARLGVAHLKDRKASSLSGGEAQRVSLARALALEPELLMLDEPFSALDSPTRARLLYDLHKLLVEMDITTIFVTHDLDEALLLGDRVAVMLESQLRQTGSPQQVFSAPVDRDVAAFVGVETVLAGTVLQSSEGQLLVDVGGYELEAVGDLEAGREVVLCLRPEDITLWPQQVGSSEMGLPQSSARNRIQGTIESITPRGPLQRVLLDCGFPLVALVTRTSVADLGFCVGKPVSAAFKASAVHLIPR